LFASHAGTLVEARLTINVVRLLKVYTAIRGRDPKKRYALLVRR